MTRNKRTRKLNISHVVPASPHACGMYETARELVLAERELGVNAHIVDPRPYERDVKGKKKVMVNKAKCPKCSDTFNVILREENISTRPYDWWEDRGVCVAPLAFSTEGSDVIVSHSGLDARWDKTDTPRIHVAHGRPNSSYRIEQSGETSIYSTYREMAKDLRWKAMITLWNGYQAYWELVFPNVKTFSPFVNLDEWQRTEGTYDFRGHGGKINVVIADIWRKDKDPFHVLNAYVLFARKYPEARLHIYALDKKPGEDTRARDTMIVAMKERGVVGEVCPLVKHLKEVYSAADILITPHRIATRTVREALACGLQVVAGHGNLYTPYTADPEDLEEYARAMERAVFDLREDRVGMIHRNRETAERSFDVRKTAGQFVNLFRELTKKAA